MLAALISFFPVVDHLYVTDDEPVAIDSRTYLRKRLFIQRALPNELCPVASSEQRLRKCAPWDYSPRKNKTKKNKKNEGIKIIKPENGFRFVRVCAAAGLKGP